MRVPGRTVIPPGVVLSLCIALGTLSGCSATPERDGDAPANQRASQQADQQSDQPTSSEAAAATAARSPAEQIVLDRTVAMVRAMQAKDLAALEDLMAPDFRLTHREIPPPDRIITMSTPPAGLPGWRWRARLATMTFGGPMSLWDIETVTVRDDTIAVNMTVHLSEWGGGGPPGREDLSGVYGLTDVWVNRDGLWRVHSRYSRPMPGAGVPGDTKIVIGG